MVLSQEEYRKKYWELRNKRLGGQEQYENGEYSKYYWKKKGKADDRKRRLGQLINGKMHKLKVEKRDYPANHCCELCGRKRKLLAYHHWDIKDKKAFGLWVCSWCHGFCETVDRFPELNIQQRYLDLKKSINKTF